MSAGAAFKPPSMHLRRVRDLLTQEGVTTDLASVIDELRGSPAKAASTLALSWYKQRSGDYRVTVGRLNTIEIRVLAIATRKFQKRPQWTVETRPVVNSSHTEIFGPVRWQPSNVVFDTMSEGRTWAAWALTQEGSNGGSVIEPNGSRGWSAL